MKPEEALLKGKLFLDEATENLTFDEFLWSFEESWHGMGWILQSISKSGAKLDGQTLGEKGALPLAGSLKRQLKSSRRPPKEAKEAVRLMEEFREELARHQGELSPKQTQKIVSLVFRVWEVHDLCSVRLGVVDERLEEGQWSLKDPSPGRLGTPVIERRTALKLLAMGGVGFLGACTAGSEAEKEESAQAQGSKDPEQQGSAAGQQREAKVAAIVALQGMHWPTADPFLFLAYHHDDYPAGNGEMAPAASLAGRHLGRDFEGRDGWRMYHGRRIPGFPRHPHRGFETVTFVRTGVLDHADSMGARARYGDGDVQWLTAGGGIQHSEMFPLINESGPNPLEFFQIWVNLPRESKMVDPYFRMLWNETIPRITEADSQGRLTELILAAGAYKEHRPPEPPPNSWAAREKSDLAIWTVRMEGGAELVLPAVQEGTRRYLYIHRGEGMKVGERQISNRNRVEIRESGPLALKNGTGETEILFLQARPIGEPIAQRGPFVMNTQEEIQQAYHDFQRTQFGGWPWRSDDPVEGKEKGRFAVLLDGSLDTPG